MTIWMTRKWALALGPTLAMVAWLVALAPGFVAAQERPDLGAIAEGSLFARSTDTDSYAQVPLEHTQVSIDVRGPVAATTVSQSFHNGSDVPIEAVYVFPLPHEAAVYEMEARLGQRVIRSVIREREEAARTYQAAKTQGRRAALLEQERPNIFTMSLANILPDEKIEVRLRYVQPLIWEAGRLRLTFPMVVGPRYVPGTDLGTHRGTGWAPDTDAVPDASRITPPVVPPGQRLGHDISVRVRIDVGGRPDAVRSPSHPIRVSSDAAGIAVVELENEVTLPNRDFVLEVHGASAAAPRTALFVSPQDGDEGHFLLATFPPAVPPVERPSMEMIFVIDVSGSMAGDSIRQAREALVQGLGRLREEDRFNVVAYSSGFTAFEPAPVSASAANLARGRSFVEGLGAAGGTQMLPALAAVLSRSAPAGHLRHIVLLTDGALGNEEQIFTLLRRNLGDARLFTVAVGSAPNHYLAANMAEYGRGVFTHIASGHEIREHMGRLLDQIESPVLTDLRLTWDGVRVADVFPARIPDLFQGQPLVVVGRIEGGAGTLRLEGRSPQGPFQAELPVNVSGAGFHPGITTLWARRWIKLLMEDWRTSHDAGTRDRQRQAVVQAAIRYHLVTRFTSLLAVEERPAHDLGTPETRAVPTALPHGWQMDAVFGANPAGGTADLFLEALGITLLAAGLLLGLLRRPRLQV